MPIPFPIEDPQFWRERLDRALSLGEIHRAAFECHLSKWRAIEEKHRRLLGDYVRPGDHILDVGCAWGRLLNLLPSTWQGRYLGIDLSPELIAIAQREHPDHLFRTGDVVEITATMNPLETDLAVMISFRPMVKRNLGEDRWQEILASIQRVSRRQLYLEYDEDDGGCLEVTDL